VHGSAPVHAFSFQSVFFGSCSYWLLHLTHSCSLDPFATAGEPIPCREKHHPNPGEHFPGRENTPQLPAKQFRARKTSVCI
jgi:hypothetical protein